ncbi:TetR family transcriptional regulator [Solibacillus sp. R5-41]|uniref:TetR/AcrR family transcriptional regulator n=1 Tax=Solibacillus sp. R5-41 TaxID=2048654 RepID=UPI000C1256C0|nr:TetR/AcrR family transcriptional regulator [Solibacillus sp. R5-41]ATP39050.1 TetR family transcriptional regulator [Solibacillus sp. R5-41]
MARGRKVNSNGERSKQLLLEKAVELFSTNGYHQTKISDIVKAADLTQPTFYLYFQSKESLYNDLNETFQQGLDQVFSTQPLLTMTNDTSTHTIQEHLKQIFDYFVKNPSLTKIGFYEAEQSSVLKERIVTNLVDVFDTDFQDYDVTQRVDKHVLAESLVGSVERLTLTNLLTNKSNPQQLAEEISHIYFSDARKLVR